MELSPLNDVQKVPHLQMSNTGLSKALGNKNIHKFNSFLTSNVVIVIFCFYPREGRRLQFPRYTFGFV